MTRLGGEANNAFVPSPLFEPARNPLTPPPATVTTLCGTVGTFTHAVTDDAPTASVNDPTGHALHVAEEFAPGSVENDAAAQGVHIALDDAPIADEYVPAGHAVALAEFTGQYEPAGHTTGAPEEQKKEAGHGTQVSCRIRLFP